MKAVAFSDEGYRAGTLDRFLAKFRRLGEDDCWPWLGSKDGEGRGNFYLDGSKVTAPSASLRLSGRPRTDNKPHALHSCRDIGCINPAHLRWGTHAENMADMVRDGTSASGRIKSCVRGHQFHQGSRQRRCLTCENAAQRARRARAKLGQNT